MKKVNNLLFTVSLIIFAVSPALAQRGTAPSPGSQPRYDRRDDMRMRVEQQNELRSLEMNRQPPVDKQKLMLQKLLTQINNDIKELNKYGDKLVESAKESNDKESAKLAEKIIKISKRLRQELNLAEPKHKLTCLPPPENIDHQEHLKQLAGAIDSEIEQFNQAQITRVVSPDNLARVSEQLTYIEIQALALQSYASSKK